MKLCIFLSVTNLLGQGIGDWKSNMAPPPTISKLGWDLCPFAVGGNARVTCTGKLKDVIAIVGIANRIKIFSVR